MLCRLWSNWKERVCVVWAPPNTRAADGSGHEILICRKGVNWHCVAPEERPGSNAHSQGDRFWSNLERTFSHSDVATPPGLGQAEANGGHRDLKRPFLHWVGGRDTYLPETFLLLSPQRWLSAFCPGSCLVFSHRHHGHNECRTSGWLEFSTASAR